MTFKNNLCPSGSQKISLASRLEECFLGKILFNGVNVSLTFILTMNNSQTTIQYWRLGS